MLRYAYEHHDDVARFVAAMIPDVRASGFERCKAIGVVDGNDELIAGLVYHKLKPSARSMELCIAALPGRRWLTRMTVVVMGHYPFVQCGYHMLVCNVLASDIRTQRQLSAVGFMLVKYPHMFGKDNDGVACLLTVDDWRNSKICQRALRVNQHKKAA
jgi:hypothetical protein